MEQASKGTGVWDLAVTIIVLALIALFSLAAIRGDYGLFRLFEVQAQKELLQIELNDVSDEADVLANKTMRLSNDFLDLDLLDEQVRRVLGRVRDDEIVIR